MSKSDRELIQDALNVHYTDWHMIDDLIKQTGNENVKERLRNIQKMKYHTEEYHAGLL